MRGGRGSPHKLDNGRGGKWGHQVGREEKRGFSAYKRHGRRRIRGRLVNMEVNINRDSRT